MPRKKKIPKKVQEAFLAEFSLQVERRGLRALDYRGMYEADTAVGTVRVAVSASDTLLHVYRQFDDLDRARKMFPKSDISFNRHCGKWNAWIAGDLVEEDGRHLVRRALDELDGIGGRNG